jgi:hypothetical protein
MAEQAPAILSLYMLNEKIAVVLSFPNNGTSVSQDISFTLVALFSITGIAFHKNNLWR